MVERANRPTQDLLHIVGSTSHSDWDDHLPTVICAYLSTPHDSTGISPFRMTFQREISMLFDLKYDTGTRHLYPEYPFAYVE